MQGLKLKKSSGRLLANNWRNVVARCKFLVTSFYNVNDTAQGLKYFAWSGSCEIQVNPCNSQKHAKYREIRKKTKRIKLPGIDYVAKNWALAMTLKDFPLVHFWSVLLMKEQIMMTSV